MTRLIASLLVFLPIAAGAYVSGVDDPASGSSLTPEARMQFDAAFTTYYQHPSIDKVNTVLDLMNDTALLRRKTAWPPLVGFLTVVFQARGADVRAWMARNDYNAYAEDVFVAALLHARRKEDALVFARAHGWKEDELTKLRASDDRVDLKHLRVLLPGHIDTLWGAFFGSGDPIYVDEIMAVLFQTQLPAGHDAEIPPGYDVLAEDKKLAQATLREYAHAHPAVRGAIAGRLARESDAGRKARLLALLSH